MRPARLSAALIAAVLFAAADPAFAQEEDEPGQAKTGADPAPAEEEMPGDAPKEVEPRDGRPCDENFMNPCPEGQVCVDMRCTVKKRRTKAQDVEVDPDYGPTTADEGGERGFRLGLQNSFLFGFAGKLKNPEPAYDIALDFGFPTGRIARWHVEIGYRDLNGYTGVKFNPFLLGFTIPLLKAPLTLEIEVIGAILQTEILFGNGYAIALSTGLRAQLVAVYGIGYVAFAPLGFEIRYAYGTEDIGIDTGAGANWPLMLVVGVEL